MAAGVEVSMCQCDWTKCRKDCKCRCHIAVEAHANHSYKVGQFSGLEQAAGFLMEKAQEAFTLREDKLAGILRGLSDDLQARAKKQHPGPDVTYEED